jgi:hypothetical protein
LKKYKKIIKAENKKTNKKESKIQNVTLVKTWKIGALVTTKKNHKN